MDKIIDRDFYSKHLEEIKKAYQESKSWDKVITTAVYCKNLLSIIVTGKQIGRAHV